MILVGLRGLIGRRGRDLKIIESERLSAPYQYRREDRSIAYFEGILSSRVVQTNAITDSDLDIVLDEDSGVQGLYLSGTRTSFVNLGLAR